MPSTYPAGPTRFASSIAVSPKPQPTSTTRPPSGTASCGKIAALWWLSPSTSTCFHRTNFGTSTSFQKSTYSVLSAAVCCMFPSSADGSSLHPQHPDRERLPAGSRLSGRERVDLP